jgi:hypothetical protein
VTLFASGGHDVARARGDASRVTLCGAGLSLGERLTIRPMPRPTRVGVRVTPGEGPSLGQSFPIVLDASGEERVRPEPIGEVSHFELRLFVDLDDGRRVGGDEQEEPDIGLDLAVAGPTGAASRSEFEDAVREAVFEDAVREAIFEDAVREAVFEDELREIEEELVQELVQGDPDLRLGPDWDRLVAAVEAVGGEAAADQHEALARLTA